MNRRSLFGSLIAALAVPFVGRQAKADVIRDVVIRVGVGPQDKFSGVHVIRMTKDGQYVFPHGHDMKQEHIWILGSLAGPNNWACTMRYMLREGHYMVWKPEVSSQHLPAIWRRLNRQDHPDYDKVRHCIVEVKVEIV